VWDSYFEFLIQVSAVLIFPIIGTFFFFKHKNLQRKINHILTNKEEFIDESQLVKYAGQGSKDQITLSLSNFLYMRAQDNYVELHYIEKGELVRFLMRSSLSRQADTIENPVIVRCHRSYMVNLIQVSAVKGNSNDLTLILKPFDTAIPVSKSYQKDTLRRLHEIKNFE
jgi:DNA-binding LytR/AlgR family response regulator